MNAWTEAAQKALISGSAASVLSTATIGSFGKRHAGNAVAPTNATSQWVWGVDRASRAHTPSLRHTATGYVIHHAISVMWATLYEKVLAGASPRPGPTAIAAVSFGTAAAALVADYVVAPRRLTPGYEAHLRLPPIVTSYLAFGLGLALATLARRR